MMLRRGEQKNVTVVSDIEIYIYIYRPNRDRVQNKERETNIKGYSHVV